MKITEVENKKIKISPHSITVKNDEGKTCGVVKNIIPFKEIPSSKRLEYSKLARQIGVWGRYDNTIDHLVICDGEAYYLDNLSLKKFVEEHKRPDNEDFFKYDEQKIKELEQIAKRAAEFVTVIPCYIMR